MCTRKQAIALIVKGKQGTISAIKAQIGEFYESFVILGFIKERLSLNSLSSSTPDSIEWEATNRAIEKNKFYNLFPA